MDYPKSDPTVGLVGGKFTDGDPAGAVAPSRDPASWANLISDELINILVAAGMIPNEADNGQVADALLSLFAPIPGNASQIFRVAPAIGASDAMPLAQVQSLLAAISTNQAAGSFKNLKLSATGASATVSVTADQIAVEAVAGGIVAINNVALAISGAVAGANGLDTGVLVASTWYAVWAIWNGTTASGLLSLSATAPTMPAGYTHKRRIGWIRTDGTANKYPFSFDQRGNKAFYIPRAGSNVTALPSMASGVASTPTSVAWGAFAPPTAARIVLTGQSANTYTIGILASALSDGLLVYDSGGSGINNISATVELFEANVYWLSSGSGSLKCYGWEDNL